MRFVATVVLSILPMSSISGAQASEQRVDRIFAAYEKPGSPGCSLGVIRDGNFIYRKAYGLGSLELNVPLSSRSVFYVGSVSKQFTAASVVLASEKGLLSLDDDIHKYIPELPDYSKTITLRQMMHHTSGLRDYLNLAYFAGWNLQDAHSTDDFIRLVASQKALNFDPGDQELYSNTNYFLLAEVVRRATNKPLSVFAAENIFRPLGMMNTRFYDDRTLVVRGRVPAYSASKEGAVMVDWSTNYDVVGGGGVMTTVDDLLLWDRNFYQNKLGTDSFLKEMLAVGVLNNGKQVGYALGLVIGDYRGLPIVEHDGALFGYRSGILRFPSQRFTVICLCNVGNARPEDLSRKVADVYLERKLGAPVSTKPAVGSALTSLNHLAGKYLNDQDHSEHTFTVRNGILFLDGAPLEPGGPNQFAMPDGTITFDDSGRQIHLTLISSDGSIATATKIEDFHLEDDAIAEYTGKYNSDELDAVYTLSLKEGHLTLQINKKPPLTLSPLVRDVFEGNGFSIVFRRNAANKISRLDVSAWRARDVHFQRIGQ